MSKSVEHKTDRGLPTGNFGMPSLNLDQCNRTAIPSDWDITEVFGDIIMCKYVDENATGEVQRNGIWVQRDVVKHLWRVVEVVLKGPSVPAGIEVGDYLMIPGDRGLEGMSKDGLKLIFINAERIFAKVSKAV